MLRVFLNGCSGHMGNEVVAAAAMNDKLKIVAGADIQIQKNYDFPIFSTAESCDVDFDVAIDFSNPKALESLVKLLDRTGKPAVICTTGLDEAMKATLQDLSAKVALFISANMSLGINVLIKLAEKSAKILYDKFDLEIIEAHHRRKIDAPSGTALLIADSINDALDHKLHYVYDRQSRHEPRQKNEMGIVALRGGNIVGEHEVLFAGEEEILSLKHSAQSRRVFADGALTAATFIVSQQQGIYNMNDLIGDI